MSRAQGLDLALAYVLELKKRGVTTFKSSDLMDNINCHNQIATYLTRGVSVTRLGTQLLYSVESFLTKHREAITWE
jgi:hypothetical protein